MRYFVIVVCLVVMFVGAVESMSSSPPPRVLVASTTQIADFARQIVGDRWVVKSLLAEGADPHTYQPTPEDIQTVLAAELCLENGMHLEGKNWMRTLAEDAQKPIVTCTKGIDPIFVEEPCHADHGHEHHHHTHLYTDPHAWFTPQNAAIYVNNILESVSKRDPDHRSEYEARAKLYLQQLRALDNWIREQVSTIPPHQRILVTTHQAFNYFCREYGFNEKNDFLSISPVGWSTGHEHGGGITPESITLVLEVMQKSGASAVFLENTVNPKHMQEIAKSAGVRVGGTLYVGSMGVPGSAAQNYIGMMRENVLKIVAGLRGED